MRVHVTYRAIEVTTRVGGGTLHRIVPGLTLSHAAEWAYVRDGSLHYRNPLDPPGRVRGVPVANLYDFEIDQEAEIPLGGDALPAPRPSNGTTPTTTTAG